MSITLSPLTPSNIRRRSMNTASFFTSCPTPSASSACHALGAIWMPAPISPNCGACSTTTLLNPLRASASAAARPPMPPPAMITGERFRGVFLEEDGDAIELSFGIHQIDALVRDAECIALISLMVAQAVLDQCPIKALFLVAELHQRQRGADAQLAVRALELQHVADLVHRARERLARMRARMA